MTTMIMMTMTMTTMMMIDGNGDCDGGDDWKIWMKITKF